MSWLLLMASCRRTSLAHDVFSARRGGREHGIARVQPYIDRDVTGNALLDFGCGDFQLIKNFFLFVQTLNQRKAAQHQAVHFVILIQFATQEGTDIFKNVFDFRNADGASDVVGVESVEGIDQDQ